MDEFNILPFMEPEENIVDDSENTVESTESSSDTSLDNSSNDSSVSSDSEDLSLEENTEEQEEIEESPKDTVVQVVYDEDNPENYDLVGLDVVGLNEMVQAYNEQTQLLSVTPTTNDYYAFIDEDVLQFFSGVMSNYPLNEYKACHLRHWIQNSQYYSYYDDYYYLWYDIANGNDCIEVIKYNGQANWVVNYTSGNVLNSTITYGSDVGQSDLRKGVSYVQEMALLCSIACVLVLYVIHAIFKHLAS